jgi:hypothetical protein
VHDHDGRERSRPGRRAELPVGADVRRNPGRIGGLDRLPARRDREDDAERDTPADQS